MRLTIPDLALGKAYQLQIKAVSATSQSAWSPILDIPATNETNTPPNIDATNITVSTGTGNAGDSFIATWPGYGSGKTKLAANISNDNGTGTCKVEDVSGMPISSSFLIIIGEGTVNEEQVLCRFPSTLAGADPNSVDIIARAQNGSTGHSHVTGESFRLVSFLMPKDFDHYEYQWLGSSNGSSTITSATVFSSTSPAATLTYSQNTALFGSPRPYINIQVRAVNTSKTPGSFVAGAAGAQNIIPSAPTSLITTTAPDSIKLEWTAPSPDPLDLDYYRIDVSTTNSTSGFVTVGTVKSPNTKYEYSSTYYDKLHWFRIYSIDKFGQTSSSYAANSVGVKVSSPAVMNGLISNITSYYRNAGSSVTFNTKDVHGMSTGNKIYIYGTRSLPATITDITGNNILTATTSAAHGFSTGDTFEIVGSSVDVFNEKSIITAITTSPPYTFSYSSASSGTFVSPATAYVLDGLATVDTVFGTPVSVTSVPNATQFICSPNAGTSTLVVESTDFTVTGATGASGFITYSLTGSGNFYPGQRVSISGVSPDQYNITDAIITSNISSSNFTIKSNATGTFISGGTASVRPFGDAYPSDNAVRIKDDGITVGNMSSGFIVGISPTSFNMQSSGSSTRLALNSSHIDMYKDGNKTIQFDGNTGDATIVGKFSTGFSPDARVELDSSSIKPESIKFYSGITSEIDPGFIETDEYTYQVASGDWNGRYYISSNLLMVAPDFVSEHVTGNPQRPFMYINGGSVSEPVTTVSSLSNGVTLPTSTLYVESTSGFPKKPVSYIGSWTGNIYVQSSAGIQTINYTGVSGNSFTNCTGGTGLISTGNSVTADVLTYPSDQVSINAGESGNVQLTSGATGSPGSQQSIFIYPTYIQISSSKNGNNNSININENGISSYSMSPVVYSYGTAVTVATGQTLLSRLPDSGSIIGTTFTAPASGKVFISVSGTIQTNSSVSKLGWFLKDGPTIGSGTTLVTGDEAAGAALVHGDAGAGNTYLMASSPPYLKTSLTPGNVYNVTFGHVNTDSSTKSFAYRKITIIPTM